MKIFLQALKILLYLVLLAALVFGIWWLVQYMKWPWWVGAAIGVGLFGLIVGILFLRKWLFRRREKKFVQRIVEQDETAVGKGKPAVRQELLDLDGRFKAAVELLKSSHLKKAGDPLYALPWHLMLGGPGSGKTSAIKGARLRAPVTDVSPPVKPGPTGSVDFVFAEQMVILDTAGRYTIPQNEDLDKEEWQRFLNLLAKYRRREPLAGLTAVIGADELTAADSDDLAQTARTIRRRIDEVMRVLGARIPVYVLVSKMDHIMGLADLAQALPEHLTAQAMGRCHDAARHEPAQVVRQAVDGVSERLKDLRLGVLLRPDRQFDPDLVLAADELPALRAKLTEFAQALFEENPYQETPIFRGLYFASGRRSGEAESRVLDQGRVFAHRRKALEPAERGMFLHDLFTDIIPLDRDLPSPLREFISWRRVTGSLAALALIALALFAGGLLTWSYHKNKTVLTEFITDFDRPPKLTDNLNQDLMIMNAFRLEVDQMSELNSGWGLPRLGLDQSLTVEQDLKWMFSYLFYHGFITRLDNALVQKMKDLAGQPDGHQVGLLIAHLATRINLVQAELNGKSLSEMKKMQAPGFLILTELPSPIQSTVAAEFKPLYLSYLDWQPSRITLERELDQLEGYIESVALYPGQKLHWLVDWANVLPDVPPVTRKDFWGATRTNNQDKLEVSGAYTLDGRKAIDQLMSQVQQAIDDPDLKQRLEKNFQAFNDWYWRQYVMAWANFGFGFDQGYIHLEDEDERRSLAETMTDLQNPYFELMVRMAKELEPVMSQDDRPDWVEAVVDFQKAYTQAQSTLKTEKDKGAINKGLSKGENVLKKAIEIPDEKAMARMEAVGEAAGHLTDYENDLAKFIQVTSSRQSAFKAAQELFAGSSAGGGSGGGSGGAAAGSDGNPLQDAESNLTKIRTTLLSNKNAQQYSNVFWHLLTGPTDYLLVYTIHEAACALQTEWEGQVLASVVNVPPKKMHTTLFDTKDGLVWKFTKGPAKNFLGRNKNGYFAQSVYDQEFPFTSSFLAFLDEGAAQTQMILPEYSVTIKARPVTVNQAALLEPYAVSLILDCPSGPQRLDNFNYPAEQTFKWKPNQCGDVTLEIRFDDFTLTKMYTGPMGFPNFLQDYYDGAQSYQAKDFPDHADDLAGINVDRIRVSYEMNDTSAIRKLLEKDTKTVPHQITHCIGS